ncbi:DUF1275 family protein [Streptomyces heilongjiangensis]|uniref:DUF1275 family protein n=1 Tax=Streptomyces heilongjiangensis TaxID=945052 RepID=A0ABW1BHC8_9ACTN|nr:DUF1275 family protein [Streptomyces heilongjiangensis]
MLAIAVAAQTTLVAASVLVAAPLDGDRVDGPLRHTLIVLLGLAMGLQNAVVRRLGVPDLTTTVLTLTLTGLAADSTPGGGPAPRPGRRILSVLAMFLGALAGALLLRHAGLTATLGLILLLLAPTCAAAWRLAGSDAAWTRPPS